MGNPTLRKLVYYTAFGAFAYLGLVIGGGVGLAIGVATGLIATILLGSLLDHTPTTPSPEAIRMFQLYGHLFIIPPDASCCQCGGKHNLRARRYHAYLEYRYHETPAYKYEEKKGIINESDAVCSRCVWRVTRWRLPVWIATFALIWGFPLYMPSNGHQWTFGDLTGALVGLIFFSVLLSAFLICYFPIFGKVGDDIAMRCNIPKLRERGYRFFGTGLLIPGTNEN